MADYTATATPVIKQSNKRMPSNILIYRSPEGFAPSMVEVSFIFGVHRTNEDPDPVTGDFKMRKYHEATIVRGSFEQLIEIWINAIGSNNVTEARINEIQARILQLDADLTALADDVAQLHVDAGGAQWPVTAHITE